MNCENLESYFVDYFEGELDGDRTAELQAHLATCPACRAEFAAWQAQEANLGRYYQAQRERAEQSPNPLELAAPLAPAPRRPLRRLAWAAAALVMLGLGLATWSAYERIVPRGHAVLATVQKIRGRVQVLECGAYRPIAEGTTLAQAQRLQVAEGGYVALRLPDGNIVEAREGTQLALNDFPDRLEVAMNRGQVWAHLNIKPKKKFAVRTAHLSAVAVGTVYGVEEAVGRSTVAVARGTVRVEAQGGETAVTQGGVYSSLDGATTGSLERLTQWSQYPEDLQALVAQEAKATPGQTAPLAVDNTPPLPMAAASQPKAIPAINDLLDLLPKETRILVSSRDFPGLLGEFRASDYAPLVSEPAVRAWWQAIRGDQYLKEFVSEIRMLEILDMARLLDGQLAFSVAPITDKDKNESAAFLLVADCRAHEAEAQAQLEKLLAPPPPTPPPSPEAASGGTVAPTPAVNASRAGKDWSELRDRIFIAQGRLVFSNSKKLAQATRARLTSGEPSGLAGSEFNRKLLQNVNNPRFMVGIDLGAMIKYETPEHKSGYDRTLSFSGLPAMDYLLISPSFKGRGMNQAARLGFKDKRFGVLNWLGEPAPMRGFDFFSPDVHFFVSAITRNPRQMLFDYMLFISQNDGNMARMDGLNAFLAEHKEFFDAFGGEVALGVDSPILPIPNIKLAIEVNDRVNCEAHLNIMMQDLARKLSESGKEASIEEMKYKERTIYRLLVVGLPFEPSWSFVDEFLIAGPGPVFVRSSIDIYESGSSIAHDSRLLSLLPRQSEPNFSILVYQDIARAVPELLKTALLPAAKNGGMMVPDLKFMERYRAAGLAYAYAWPSYVDLYLNTPTGIDFNMGMAVPLVANWLAPFTSVGKAVDKYAAAVVALEALQGAAEKFEQKNGHLPQSLGELADPAYIDRIPADPFAPNGNDTLRLIPGPAAGQITLYSIGPDKNDDQGRVVVNPDRDVSGPGDIVIRLPQAPEAEAGGAAEPVK